MIPSGAAKTTAPQRKKRYEMKKNHQPAAGTAHGADADALQRAGGHHRQRTNAFEYLKQYVLHREDSVELGGIDTAYCYYREETSEHSLTHYNGEDEQLMVADRLITLLSDVDARWLRPAGFTMDDLGFGVLAHQL